MRIILMLITMVVISLLVLKGYPGGGSDKESEQVLQQQTEAIDKARQASQQVEDAIRAQQQAIQQQVQ